MENMDHQHHKMKPRNAFWKNPLVWVCLAAIGYWVYTYHLEHALGFLPYLILLLCPLMHIFMHGGHHHGHHSNDEKKEGQ